MAVSKKKWDSGEIFTIPFNLLIWTWPGDSKSEAISLGHHKVQGYIKERNKREDRYLHASLIQTTDLAAEFQMPPFPELPLGQHGL